MFLGCGDASSDPVRDAGDRGSPGDGGATIQDSGAVAEPDAASPGLDAGPVEPTDGGGMDSAAADAGSVGSDAGDACAPSPCLNGSACSSAADAGAICTCAAGWEGKLCDENIDDCATAGCAHATGCTDGLNDFTCACESGWQGKLCDTAVGGCTENPCMHATGCENQGNDYVCSCEAGWFGKNCDTFCDDGKASTTDSLHPVYGCAHRTGDWTTFDKGIYADHVTGLGWWANVGPIGYENLKVACADLDKAGLADWRLPTINEARSLGGDCAPTAPGGTCTISDPSCLDQSCGYGVGAECSSCIGGPGGSATHPSGAYCRPDVTLCSNWWTSSVCSDCATTRVWFYGVTNGNFYHDEPTGGRSGACVTVLPNL